MSVMERYLLRKENIVIAFRQLGHSTYYKNSKRFFDPVTGQLSVECSTKAKAWPCASLQILAFDYMFFLLPIAAGGGCLNINLCMCWFIDYETLVCAYIIIDIIYNWLLL